MIHHVVFLERDSLKVSVREAAFPHTYEEHGRTASDQVVAHLKDATIAIINKVGLNEEALVQLPRLKMVAIAATGYDAVDIAACRARGIAVANIRNYAVHTVPEHVFAMA